MISLHETRKNVAGPDGDRTHDILTSGSPAGPAADWATEAAMYIQIHMSQSGIVVNPDDLKSKWLLQITEGGRFIDHVI